MGSEGFHSSLGMDPPQVEIRETMRRTRIVVNVPISNANVFFAPSGIFVKPVKADVE